MWEKVLEREPLAKKEKKENLKGDSNPFNSKSSPNSIKSSPPQFSCF